MVSKRLLALIAAAMLVVASCGGDADSPDTSPTSSSESTTTVAISSTTTVTSTTEAADTDQPAIWPATDVVFATPEEAAADFVATVLGVPPELGEFRQGDARSGEIEVYSLGEGGSADPPIVRSVLLLRQLGADDGWFVLAAVGENATIAEPESMAEVAAGQVEVQGRARGFEGTVLVSAFPAGDADTELDLVISAGGARAEPEPYTASVDLSAAVPGDVVAVLVRGGTGLETDPGDFSAVPVVVSG